MKAFYLVLTALVALATFAGLSPWRLALQLASFVLVNLLGVIVLRSPTSAGRDWLDHVPG